MASFSEAMELDSAPTPTSRQAHQEAVQQVQRYLEAREHAKKLSRTAKDLKKAASTSTEANELFQGARTAAKEAHEAADKLKQEAGLPSKPRKRTRANRNNANRDHAMTGVKMSTRSGIIKKTKVKMSKVTNQPSNKVATGTGVYGWSVNDGDKELDLEEIRELQAKNKLGLLLPPPQIEGEVAAAPRATRAERKDANRAKALAMMTAAEGKLTLKNTLTEELQNLQADQYEFMGKVTIADWRNDEVRRERVRAVGAVGAVEERTMEENTEIDAIAEQLGLVSMGRKRGT